MTKFWKRLFGKKTVQIEDFQPWSPKGHQPKENACAVHNKNNTQVVTMPDGTVIPGQVWSRTWTGIDDHNYVIVKLLVNVK